MYNCYQATHLIKYQYIENSAKKNLRYYLRKRQQRTNPHHFPQKGRVSAPFQNHHQGALKSQGGLLEHTGCSVIFKLLTPYIAVIQVYKFKRPTSSLHFLEEKLKLYQEITTTFSQMHTNRPQSSWVIQIIISNISLIMFRNDSSTRSSFVGNNLNNIYIVCLAFMYGGLYVFCMYQTHEFSSC